MLATSGEFAFIARWYRMEMPFAAGAWGGAPLLLVHGGRVPAHRASAARVVVRVLRALRAGDALQGARGPRASGDGRRGRTCSSAGGRGASSSRCTSGASCSICHRGAVVRGGEPARPVVPVPVLHRAELRRGSERTGRTRSSTPRTSRWCCSACFRGRSGWPRRSCGCCRVPGNGEKTSRRA